MTHPFIHQEQRWSGPRSKPNTNELAGNEALQQRQTGMLRSAKALIPVRVDWWRHATFTTGLPLSGREGLDSAGQRLYSEATLMPEGVSVNLLWSQGFTVRALAL